MKKILFYFMAVATISVVVISCGDKKEDAPSPAPTVNKIIGLWTQTKFRTTMYVNNAIVMFDSTVYNNEKRKLNFLTDSTVIAIDSNQSPVSQNDKYLLVASDLTYYSIRPNGSRDTSEYVVSYTNNDSVMILKNETYFGTNSKNIIENIYRRK